MWFFQLLAVGGLVAAVAVGVAALVRYALGIDHPRRPR